MLHPLKSPCWCKGSFGSCRFGCGPCRPWDPAEKLVCVQQQRRKPVWVQNWWQQIRVARCRNEITFRSIRGDFEEWMKGSWVSRQLWTQITWTQGSFWWRHTQSVHSQGLTLLVVSYGGCRHTLELNKPKASVRSSVFSRGRRLCSATGFSVVTDLVHFVYG